MNLQAATVKRRHPDLIQVATQIVATAETVERPETQSRQETSSMIEKFLV